MQTKRLGKTNIMATAVSFGALPVQRCDMADATAILRAAYDNGIRYFDTARAYTDSEEKIGNALSDVRGDIAISSKSGAKTGAQYTKDLETSLRLLKTDHIDIHQFHNPSFVPKPGGEDGLYEAALKAKSEGKILHIGITQHSMALAMEAIESGLYETMQYPFSYLASADDYKIVDMCREHDMGFIAMKGLSGGLLTNARAIHAFMRSMDIVVPIYGVQRMHELEEFLQAEREQVELNDELRAIIEKDRGELMGSFCRGCGYCMPCPKGIPLNNAARIIQMLKRSPVAGWLRPEFHELMSHVDECVHCGVCATRCPYHLKPYELAKEGWEFYKKLYAEHNAAQRSQQ